MKTLVVVVVLGVVAACETGDKGGIPDANPNAPLCTGQLYDNCTDGSQCMSGMCHLFSGEFRVCTQTCSAGDSSTCPTSTNGAAAKCNNRGICKPALDNACRPPG